MNLGEKEIAIFSLVYYNDFVQFFQNCKNRDIEGDTIIMGSMWKSRWMISCLLAMAILCTSCVVSLADGPVATSTANDIVIVLDQSKSMDQADPDFFRLDAAEMIAAMCDIEHSRVAFVPFAGDVDYRADKDFTLINTLGTRLEKIEQIDKFRDVNTKEDTDLGGALNLAVRMLNDRTDKSNQPMIIVLTDGKNDIEKRNSDKNGKKRYSSRDIYIWDDNTKTFYKEKAQSYTAKTSDDQQEGAVQAAQHFGIPIYALALRDPKNENLEFESRLASAAKATNGKFATLDSPEKLPMIFGDFFAAQIGSAMKAFVEPEPVPNTTNRYRMYLPVLNQSIQETNVFIPLEGIKKDSIELYDQDNERVGSSQAGGVYFLESKNFTILKLCSPDKIGDWRLEFETENENVPVDSIAINLLYSYDIDFKTRLGTQEYRLNDPGAPITLHKNDTLYFSSSFYNIDANGNSDTRSTDKYLYAVRDSEDDWRSIHVSYVLESGSGVTMAQGGMDSDEHSCFTGSLDMCTVNKLSSGSYVLCVIADGVGLHREEEIAITIDNRAPEWNGGSAMRQRIVVNDPSKPETMKAQSDIQFDLSNFATDPDGDPMSFHFTPVKNAADLLKVRVEEQPDGSVCAVCTTVEDATGVRYGLAEYTLNVVDKEGESVVGNVSFDIVSLRDSVLADILCNTTAVGITNGQAEKNTDITFEMTITDANGGPVQQGSIQNFVGAVAILDANSSTGKRLATVDMTPGSTGTKLTGTWKTGNVGANLKAVCNYSFGGGEVPEQEIPFTIPNHAPQLNSGAETAIPQTLTYDPLPEFFSFLEQPTPESERTVDLATLFTDKDNEQLSYLATVLDGKANLDISRTDNTIVLTVLGFGNTTVELSATDGDGQTARVTYEIRLVSLVHKWLAILAAIVVVVAVVVLICLAARPRFAKGLKLDVRVDNVVTPYQVAEGMRGQSKIPLSRYVNEPSALEDSGVTLENLKCLRIKPKRGGSGSLKLTRKGGKNSGMEALLNDMPVGKKAMIWQVGETLEVRSTPGAQSKLVIRLEQTDSLSSGVSGGDPFATQAAPAKGRKKRKAAVDTSSDIENW